MSGGTTEQRADGKLLPIYGFTAIASLGIAIWIGWFLFNSQERLIQNGAFDASYYVLLLVLGISTAFFLFGVLKSTAHISGTKFGIAVDVGGPAAMAVLVVAGGYWFTRLPESFDLTVRLQGTDEIAQMSENATVSVDLDGRRETSPVQANGETTIKEIPSHFIGKQVPILFESRSYRKAPTSPEKYNIPANKVIYIQILRVSENEIRSRELASAYERILLRLSDELERKQEFMFPAIETYLHDPKPENWRAVVREATDSLKEIRETMDSSVHYDAQARLMAQVEGLKAFTENSPQFASFQPAFHPVIVTHQLRGITLQEIANAQQPTESQVRAWDQQLRARYNELRAELTTLVQALKRAS